MGRPWHRKETCPNEYVQAGIPKGYGLGKTLGTFNGRNVKGILHAFAQGLPKGSE